MNDKRADEITRLKAEIAALKARVEEHEKFCAGVWVPVGEMNPEIAGNYLVVHANTKSATRLELMDYQRGKWMCAKIWEPTHWLDAKLPGEQR